MGERHVGLDIGSFAVRAAEVSVDAGVPVLHRFAQITLPPRAVVQGEILDQIAVTAAIRELWAKGGFKVKKVVVGVSNREVKVRQTEVPALSPDEVRSALRYDTQDVMPIADDGSIVDFLVQSRFERDGVDMLNVLMVVAPRGGIDDVVAASSAAGLTVEAVDFTPFALVRALAARRDPGVGEVIVSVGAGLTSVVVHIGGVPQLVRTTPGGGGVITEALATSLSVRYEEAEAIKRIGSAHTTDDGRVAALIETEFDTLVRDIAGSVDYFVAQTAESDVRRIVLTGAGSLVPGLRERIAAESHLPVVPADALTNVTLGKTRLTPEQLVAASTSLAGPVGLALAPLADPNTRLTSLLPQAYIERLHNQRQAKGVVAALCVLAVVLGGLWLKRGFDVRAAQGGVTHALHLERSVEARDTQYAALAAEEAAIQRQTKQVALLLNNDTDVSAILDQVAGAIPPDAWLGSAVISLPSAKSGGTATFTVSGVDETTPARWLTNMRALTSTFSSVWVTSVTRAAQGTAQSVTFASQAVLARGVVSHRAAGFGVPK
jgi:type IV pilus assembly protein PilM